jgi:hypothetical protein
LLLRVHSIIQRLTWIIGVIDGGYDDGRITDCSIIIIYMYYKPKNPREIAVPIMVLMNVIDGVDEMKQYDITIAPFIYVLTPHGGK